MSPSPSPRLKWQGLVGEDFEFSLFKKSLEVTLQAIGDAASPNDSIQTPARYGAAVGFGDLAVHLPRLVVAHHVERRARAGVASWVHLDFDDEHDVVLLVTPGTLLGHALGGAGGEAHRGHAQATQTSVRAEVHRHDARIRSGTSTAAVAAAATLTARPVEVTARLLVLLPVRCLAPVGRHEQDERRIRN